MLYRKSIEEDRDVWERLRDATIVDVGYLCEEDLEFLGWDESPVVLLVRAHVLDERGRRTSQCEHLLIVPAAAGETHGHGCGEASDLADWNDPAGLRVYLADGDVRVCKPHPVWNPLLVDWSWRRQ